MGVPHMLHEYKQQGKSAYHCMRVCHWFDNLLVSLNRGVAFLFYYLWYKFELVYCNNLHKITADTIVPLIRVCIIVGFFPNF